MTTAASIDLYDDCVACSPQRLTVDEEPAQEVGSRGLPFVLAFKPRSYDVSTDVFIVGSTPGAGAALHIPIRFDLERPAVENAIVSVVFDIGYCVGGYFKGEGD